MAALGSNDATESMPSVGERLTYQARSSVFEHLRKYKGTVVEILALVHPPRDSDPKTSPMGFVARFPDGNTEIVFLNELSRQVAA